MKLTITEATNHDKKKDNTPILDNRGKQKYRSVIKTVEKGNEFLSGFVYRPLQAGDVIEADVTSEMYNNKPQLKFAIKAAPQQQAQASQNNSEVMAELKNHTVLQKEILNRLEAIYMSISTHQTIEALRNPKPNTAIVPQTSKDEFVEGSYIDPTHTEAVEVADENDYGPLGGEFPN